MICEIYITLSTATFLKSLDIIKKVIRLTMRVIFVLDQTQCSTHLLSGLLYIFQRLIMSIHVHAHTRCMNEAFIPPFAFSPFITLPTHSKM